MPELAEVRLTSEFIAKYKDTTFTALRKSEVSKVKTDLGAITGNFKIDSSARGKELVIDFFAESGTRRMKVTLGMSGTWVYYDPTDDRVAKLSKHAHLQLVAENGDILALYDPRRFAKWSWNVFDPRRGHCPYSEFEKFNQALLDSWQTSDDFKHPVSEVIMSQRWFNGVGNYLRAEILYRADINPFSDFDKLTREEVTKVANLVNECVTTAYKLGGGQLRDWKSPSGENPVSFREWIKCYGKLSSKVDGTGRTFWFDKKWDI